jgi:tripartite-type tricarboxylate transporter receptor subunit TctC
VRAHLQAGALRALAVTGAERAATLPDVPTVAESGYPGFEVISWYGLFAPAGTPRGIVDQLQLEAASALRSQEARERLTGLGAVSVANTPDAFAREIRALRTFWPPLIKAAGVPVE